MCAKSGMYRRRAWRAIGKARPSLHTRTQPLPPPTPPAPPDHHQQQASATTNYVYVAASDPLAAAQFVEVGPL